MVQTDAILEVAAVSKSYKGKAAVRDLSLTVGRGQVFGLLGPNGSGKTTTLGMILGALHPDRGSISWFGATMRGKQRRRIGALLEQPSFYPWLSGVANLRLIAAVKHLPGATAEPALKRVGLWEARRQQVQAYSLGMKQRLAIATTLLGAPEVLVLDEPTNGIDAQGIADIRQLIHDFAALGGTVLLASHMLDEVEKICSHVAIMKQGVALRIGDIGQVLATSGWLEVSSSDIAALSSSLRDLEPEAHFAGTQPIQIHGGKLAAADLNRQLVARGIYVNHLLRRQPSLESQYLQLVADGSQP